MGNRVKGRVKKKSIKAASHSGMGSKRKLSRMGKKQKRDHSGLDATFIGRSACLKKLQISLKDFRRLCILKGVYPREPRGRAPGKKRGQVFYHVKDVRAIAHEPVLHKFREFRAFMKKVRRAAGRNDKDEARRMETYAPSYTLHHLVRERYPRFSDAVSDLDDALTLIYLFAALPSEGRIRSKVTDKARSLAASWGAYCASSSGVTKNFVSVKGVYVEAEVRGSTVRWIVPHAFTQNLPRDVDYRVMLTFFEFYETLLGFVLYKLYSDMGVRYPLPVNKAQRAGASTLLAANIRALGREVRGGKGSASDAVGEALAEAEAETEKGKDVDAEMKDDEDEKDDGAESKRKRKKSRALIRSVDAALDRVKDDDDDDSDAEGSGDEGAGGEVDVSAPLKAALETLTEEEGGGGASAASGGADGVPLGDEAAKRRRLFSGLTFFVSREVPRGYVELVILSYGGKVGWEGDDSPISVKDTSVTHHIVDRPKIPASFGSNPASREYVQPQWVLDCANFRFLLPCSRYAVGVELPPHLSPWVDDEEEGYKPAYKDEVERIKNGEILPDARDDDVEAEGEGESADEAEKAKASEAEEKKKEEERSDSDSDSEEEDDDTKAEKAKKRKRDEDEEAKEMARMMMSKKAARLYGRMQHGLNEKQAKVDELHRRRRDIEGKGKGKDGKNVVKQKAASIMEEQMEKEEEVKAKKDDAAQSAKKKKEEEVKVKKDDAAQPTKKKKRIEAEKKIVDTDGPTKKKRRRKKAGSKE